MTDYLRQQARATTTTSSNGCSPTTRRSGSASSRTAAGSPTLRRDERRPRDRADRADRARGRAHRRRRHPPARRARARHRLPRPEVPVADRDRRPATDALQDRVGRRADRVPRHHRARLPEPVLPLRAEHEPGRGQRDLHARVPGRLRHPVPRAPRRAGRTRRWSAARTCTTSTTRASTPSTSRWSGGTRQVHSYYNNDDGRVVTNAPWRLLDYWRMTREPDPDDFVLVPAAERRWRGRDEAARQGRDRHRERVRLRPDHGGPLRRGGRHASWSSTSTPTAAPRRSTLVKRRRVGRRTGRHRRLDDGGSPEHAVAAAVERFGRRRHPREQRRHRAGHRARHLGLRRTSCGTASSR